MLSIYPIGTELNLLTFQKTHEDTDPLVKALSRVVEKPDFEAIEIIATRVEDEPFYIEMLRWNSRNKYKPEHKQEPKPANMATWHVQVWSAVSPMEQHLLGEGVKVHYGPGCDHPASLLDFLDMIAFKGMCEEYTPDSLGLNDVSLADIQRLIWLLNREEEFYETLLWAFREHIDDEPLGDLFAKLAHRELSATEEDIVWHLTENNIYPFNKSNEIGYSESDFDNSEV